MQAAPDTAWQHDMYVDQAAPAAFPGVSARSIETGTKLYISNLDYGVSNEDIKVISLYSSGKFTFCSDISTPLVVTTCIARNAAFPAYFNMEGA